MQTSCMLVLQSKKRPHAHSLLPHSISCLIWALKTLILTVLTLPSAKVAPTTLCLLHKVSSCPSLSCNRPCKIHLHHLQWQQQTSLPAWFSTQLSMTQTSCKMLQATQHHQQHVHLQALSKLYQQT